MNSVFVHACITCSSCKLLMKFVILLIVSLNFHILLLQLLTFEIKLFLWLSLQVLICRNEAEKCLIETSINSLRISIKVILITPWFQLLVGAYQASALTVFVVTTMLAVLLLILLLCIRNLHFPWVWSRHLSLVTFHVLTESGYFWSKWDASIRENFTMIKLLDHFLNCLWSENYQLIF